MKFRLLSALSLSLACAAAIPAPAAPAAAPAPATSALGDPATAKNYLQVTEYTAAGSRRFTLADETLFFDTPDLKVTDGSDPYATPTRRTVQVAADQARAAWERIAHLDIFHWRGIYDSRDLGQEDPGGTEWSLDLRLGDKKKHSRGNNAFPGVSPVGIPELGGGGGRDPDTAYTELMSILQDLVPKAT